MALFWTILVIALICLEAATVQFVSIWFAGGAFAALIAAMSGAGIWLQTVIFVIISALLLIFTRKLIRKLKAKEPLKTNTDALIGQNGTVLELISNINSSGSVKVGAMVWSARSENGEDIPAGTTVTVKKIDGVKLIVDIKKED